MLNLIRPSYIQMKLTCVKNVFLNLFSEEERKEGKKNKKSFLVAKKQFGKGAFVY